MRRIVRAFIKIRVMLTDTRDWSQKLAVLEHNLKRAWTSTKLPSCHASAACVFPISLFALVILETLAANQAAFRTPDQPFAAVGIMG